MVQIKRVGGLFIHAQKDTRWEKIGATKDFWANLEWMLKKKLWQFIQRYDAHILSAYSSNDGNSKDNGKMKWLPKIRVLNEVVYI